MASINTTGPRSGEFSLVTAFLFLVHAAGYGQCFARQTPPVTLHTPPTATTTLEISLSELDALAANVAKEIMKKNARTVVVVGGGGPGEKVTELGAEMRDAFNVSLARQTQGAHVLDGAGVRDMLHRSRVSEGMFYTDVIAAWIAQHSSADACVIFRILGLNGSHAVLEAQLFTKDKKGFQSNYRISSGLTLTDAQVAQADADYHPTPNVPDAVPVKAVPGVPKCLICPHPSWDDEVRRLRIKGTVILDVVVRPEGIADDIQVLKPLGHGLDANAIDAILKWKFEPAKDTQGQAVAMHISIEITYEFY